MNKPAAPKKPSGSMTGLRTGPRARAALERAYRARAQQPADAPREGASPRGPRSEGGDRGDAPARPRRSGDRGFEDRRPQERRPSGEGFRGRSERDDGARGNDRDAGRGRPRGEFRGPRSEEGESRFPRERSRFEGGDRPRRDAGDERRIGSGPRPRPTGDRPRREGDDYPRRPREEGGNREGRFGGAREERPRGEGFERPRREGGEYPRRPREEREGREGREGRFGGGAREERPRGQGFDRPPRERREPRSEDDGRHGGREGAPRAPRRDYDKPVSRERSSWSRDRDAMPERENRGRVERPRQDEERKRPVEGVRGAYERRLKPAGAEGRPQRAWRDDSEHEPRKPRASFEREPAPAPRREPRAATESVQVSTQEGVRVSKLMTERGLCSRREADEYIERGWVFADGERVKELGTRVSPNAEITLSPKAAKAQFERVTILMHKPVGVVSGQAEDDYEPAISLINEQSQYRPDGGQRFKPQHLKNLAPAGRLDIDSTGLLVLTQDGRIAKLLVGDHSKVEKEYLVRVEGRLIENGLELLNHGLELDDKPLRPAKVSWQNEDQLRFVLREGRKRQVRRMCELVGLRVVGLKRVRIGRVMLGDLPLGQWRYLGEDESFD